MKPAIELLQRYVQRLQGIVSSAFHRKTIVVAGLGGGSFLVEKLARLSPACLRLCDFDAVELHNLPRQAFTFEEAMAGAFKTDATVHRVTEINPFVEVQAFTKNVLDCTPAETDALLDGAHGILAGTDSLTAQAWLNEQSFRRGIPAVFVGIHARARGGRVVLSVPGETPCYRCVARERFLAQEKNPGAVDLAGEAGAIFDGQFIDDLALKMLVAALERGQDSDMGRFYELMRGRTDVVVRCHPEYAWGSELWNALLGDLPAHPKDFARELKEQALFAMDSIWLRPERDPDCPVCGGKQRPGVEHLPPPGPNGRWHSIPPAK